MTQLDKNTIMGLIGTFIVNALERLENLNAALAKLDEEPQ